MVERTGTLWEHNGLQASANHGFASHALCWLLAPIAGVRTVDQVGRRVELHFTDSPLEHASVRLPLPEGGGRGMGWLELSWRRRAGVLTYRLSVPAGYRVAVSADPGVTIAGA
jgi:hypothetical protein